MFPPVEKSVDVGRRRFKIMPKFRRKSFLLIAKDTAFGLLHRVTMAVDQGYSADVPRLAGSHVV